VVALAIDMELAHKAVFFALYFLLFLATVAFMERFLYFVFTFPGEKKALAKEIEESPADSVEFLYHSRATKLRRGKGVLAFTITASPLLGLLGTIFGIMDSFITMAEKGISDVASVSKGIAFALEATALGIAIAVIALVYYYIVTGVAGKCDAELRSIALTTTPGSAQAFGKGG
jgi:biopolymer transport protein ExbB